MVEPRGRVATPTKTCSRCDRRFGCGQGDPGCWCEAIELRRETLAEIRAVAEDCICPACLSAFATEERTQQDGAAASDRPDDHATTWAKAVPHTAVRSRGVSAAWGFASLSLLGGALLVALAIGPASIGPGPIAGSVLSHLPLIHVRTPLDGVDEAILWQVRAPRVVLAALVGGMLAVAGSAYQGVFRNPLADPYLLGVAAGAGLGATVAIAYGSVEGDRALLLPPSAFAGATAGVGAA